MDVDGAQMLGKLLQQCVLENGATSESLAAAAALVRIVQGAKRKTPEVVHALLTGPFAETVCTLVTAAAEALANGTLVPGDTTESLILLLTCVDHLRARAFKQKSVSAANGEDAHDTQVDVRGRIIMAPYAVPALLQCILLIRDCKPEDREDLLNVVKVATETLSRFVGGPEGEGARVLAEAPAATAGAALNAVLSLCGDGTLQLDLCEMIYLCIKANSKLGTGAPTLHDSVFFQSLKELISKKDRDEEVYLPSEYHKIVFDFNLSAEKAARVASLAPAAPEVTVGGQAFSFPPNSCVYLGETFLSIMQLMAAPPDENPNASRDAGEAAAQPLVPATSFPFFMEFPYHIVSDCTISPSSVAGASTLTFTLKEMPLGFAPAPEGGERPTVVMTLRTADLAQLKENVPIVAASIERAGISLPTGEAEGSD